MTDRNAVVAAVVLGILVLASHVAGALLYPDQLWGVHLYAFLPSPLLPIAIVLLGAALIALPLGARRVDRAIGRLPDPSEWSRGRRRGVVLFVVATAKYWFLRPHVLGDGNPLTKASPAASGSIGQPAHGDDSSHRLARGRRAVRRAHEGCPQVSRLTVALDSALAGELFALVAWALAGEVCPPAGPARRTLGGRTTACVCWCSWCCHARLRQLFCGYVEELHLAHARHRALHWRRCAHCVIQAHLSWPGVALLLAVGCHLAAYCCCRRSCCSRHSPWRGRSTTTPRSPWRRSPCSRSPRRVGAHARARGLRPRTKLTR
jgi:hypothetical protein